MTIILYFMIIWKLEIKRESVKFSRYVRVNIIPVSKLSQNNPFISKTKRLNVGISRTAPVKIDMIAFT